MTIPDAAIEAAAEAIREAWPADLSARLLARAAVEAALPAIREAIAQEIEKCYVGADFGRNYDGTESPDTALGHAHDEALHHAVRIVRGGTP